MRALPKVDVQEEKEDEVANRAEMIRRLQNPTAGMTAFEKRKAEL